MICEDCLERFARDYFAPYLCRVERRRKRMDREY